MHTEQNLDGLGGSNAKCKRAMQSLLLGVVQSTCFGLESVSSCNRKFVPGVVESGAFSSPPPRSFHVRRLYLFVARVVLKVNTMPVTSLYLTTSICVFLQNSSNF